MIVFIPVLSVIGYRYFDRWSFDDFSYCIVHYILPTVLLVWCLLAPVKNFESRIETPTKAHYSLSGKSVDLLFLTDITVKTITATNELFLLESGCREFKHEWGDNVFGSRRCRGYTLINNCVPINECE